MIVSQKKKKNFCSKQGNKKLVFSVQSQLAVCQITTNKHKNEEPFMV